PYNKYNKFDAMQDPTTGDITVIWSLINGVSGRIRQVSEEAMASSKWQDKVVGALAYPTNYLLDSIDGNMTLTYENGTYVIKSLNQDAYPSLGIYYYEGGVLSYTIDERSETQFPGGLGPVALNPLYPNDKYTQ